MKHLEDEDIGRMIEGTVSKKERENFLEHLSRCSTCFEVYTDTLKVAGKGRKPKVKERFFNLIGKLANHPFWQIIRQGFKNKIPVPARAFALLIIIFLTVLVFRAIQPPASVIHLKVRHIEKSAGENGMYTFSRSKNKIYAAIRVGIFVEDLSVIVNTTGKKEVREKITKMLKRELNIFLSKNNSIFKELENIDGKTAKKVFHRIRELMNSQSYSELFSFGRFLEQGIFDSFENKKPGGKDIEKYRQIVIKYNLPRGFLSELEKLEKARDVKESRNIHRVIKELLF